MIERDISQQIKNDFNRGKIIVVLGARQVGKTTLLDNLTKDEKDVLMLNCDNYDDRADLENKISTELKNLIGHNKIVVIDEAQRVKNIGLTLKIIADMKLSTQVLVTVSSSLEISSYSRNVRNEIKKGKKIYFYDNGIRNALISNFSSLELRTDTGALWENLMISERLKYNAYNRTYSQLFFWRTQQQQEIDLIEERDGKIMAYEFKWNEKKKASLPAIFQKNYPNTEFKIINRDNYMEFV